MKNLPYALALVLALTGVANTHCRSAAAKSSVVAAKASAFPIPTCPWNDPNACGISGPMPNVVQR